MNIRDALREITKQNQPFAKVCRVREKSKVNGVESDIYYNIEPIDSLFYTDKNWNDPLFTNEKKLNSKSAWYYNVPITINNTSTTKYYNIPKLESLVIITFLNDNQPLIIAQTETVEYVFNASSTETENTTEVRIKTDEFTAIANNIIFNNGDNGGMIKINELTTKLNNLITEVTQLKTSLSTHVHPVSGAVTLVTTTPILPSTFSQFNKNDYENENFTH